jgi:hypothetical protein
MEQEPYEFRIRPAKPESKGKATHGSIRKYAFLASHQTIFLSADARSEWLGVYAAPLVRAMKLRAGRTHG